VFHAECLTIQQPEFVLGIHSPTNSFPNSLDIRNKYVAGADGLWLICERRAIVPALPFHVMNLRRLIVGYNLKLLKAELANQNRRTEGPPMEMPIETLLFAPARSRSGLILFVVGFVLPWMISGPGLLAMFSH
jgi:hypothetical protein